MKSPARLVLFALALATGPLAAATPASAGDDYHSVAIVYPSGHLRTKHANPYPMSRLSAEVWRSDACWRGCTGRTAWRYEKHLPTLGPDYGRDALDIDNRACLLACRTKGGPLVKLLP